MSHLSKRLLVPLASIGAFSAVVAGAPAAAGFAQTGLGQLGDALPHSRALRVLRQMQIDSVRVDSRHYAAAQRCDRAAMAAYQRQLDDLAAQARNVIRNSGLINDTSSNAIEADRIASNIEMRARHASSRQAQNCDQAATGEPTGGTGTSGTGRSQSSDEQLGELQKESVRLNTLHYEAAQRCDRAEMARIQALLEALVDQAAAIMQRAAAGPRGAKSAVFRSAERIAHNIAQRSDEARNRQPKNCPEQTEQPPSGAGETNTTPPSPPQEQMPPPEQSPPPPPERGASEEGQKQPRGSPEATPPGEPETPRECGNEEQCRPSTVTKRPASDQPTRPPRDRRRERCEDGQSPDCPD